MSGIRYLLRLTAVTGMMFLASAGASHAAFSPTPQTEQSVVTPQASTAGGQSLGLSICHKRRTSSDSEFHGVLRLSALQIRALLAAMNPSPAPSLRTGQLSAQLDTSREIVSRGYRF